MSLTLVPTAAPGLISENDEIAVRVVAIENTAESLLRSQDTTNNLASTSTSIPALSIIAQQEDDSAIFPAKNLNPNGDSLGGSEGSLLDLGSGLGLDQIHDKAQDLPPIGELIVQLPLQSNADHDNDLASQSSFSFMSLNESGEAETKDVSCTPADNTTATNNLPVLVELEDDEEPCESSKDIPVSMRSIQRPAPLSSRRDRRAVRLSARRVRSADAATLKQRMTLAKNNNVGPAGNASTTDSTTNSIASHRRRRHSPKRSKTADGRIITCSIRPPSTLSLVKKSIRIPKRRLSKPSIVNQRRSSLGRTFTIDARMMMNNNSNGGNANTGPSALERMSRRMRTSSKQ